MRTVVHGPLPAELEEYLAKRARLGLDRRDEVWEGEYHMSPAPNRRHADLDAQLGELLGPRARAVGLRPYGNLNIGEKENYRIPDRSFIDPSVERDIYLPTATVVVEILSQDDDTCKKFPFYATRAVAEILVVDPAERTVQWFVRAEANAKRRPNPSSRRRPASYSGYRRRHSQPNSAGPRAPPSRPGRRP